MRMPKLLQPSPTTLTVSEPIVRVSMAAPPLWSLGPCRATGLGSSCTGGIGSESVRPATRRQRWQRVQWT